MCSSGTPYYSRDTYVVDWPVIVEQQGPHVWRTAYRLLSDREEANDCYQETFLQAFEFSQKRNIENWPGLLKRIATARALDRLRRRYRSHSEPLENGFAIVGREPAPDEPAQVQEWMDQLRHAIAELPERQAEVFWLSEIEKLRHAEIATQLDVTTKQIAVWLHRAKQKLRQLLVERGIADEVKS